MSTSPLKIGRLLALRLVLLTLALTLFPGGARSLELESEVTVLIEQGHAVADSPLSGRREIPLDVQETVLGSGASGLMPSS